MCGTLGVDTVVNYALVLAQKWRYNGIEKFMICVGNKGDNNLVLRKKMRSKSCCHWNIYSTKVEFTKE